MRFVPLGIGVVVLLAFSFGAIGSDPETWPIVYQDDFEDPASGWLTGETEYASCAYVDGAYEIQVKDDWRIAWSEIPGCREYLDFAAEVAFRFVAGEGEAGFLFRYQDSDNFYCFTISIQGEYGLWRFRYDEWETLIDWTPFTGLDPTGWNWLRIVAQGDRFSLFLNGEPLAEFRDDAFRAGQLALCASTFEEPGLVVRFDELAVREDPQVRTLAERAKSLFDRGKRAYRSWNLEEAVANYEQALSVYQVLEWREKEADCHLELGNCWRLLSDFHKAVKHYQESLAISREIGYWRGEARSLMGLGSCYAALGDYWKAIDYFEQSLAICREIGDRQGEAASLNNLGVCYHSLGDYQKAIDYHEESLAICREIGDRQGEARSLNNLGNCYSSLGDYREAIDHYEQSLAIFREIGDRQGVAYSLMGLGVCYRSLGDYRKAINYYEESLAIFHEIGDRRGEAASLNNLGVCYEDLGDYRRAIDYFEQSLAICREIGDWWGEAYSLNNLGNCYGALGDYRRAIDYHEQSLAICREIGDRWGEAISLNNLGNCYYSLGDYQRAIEYYQECLQVVQEIAAEEGYRTGAPETLWRLYTGLGSSYQALGDLPRAAQAWKQAVETIEWMRGRLARVEFKTGFMRGKYFVYRRLIPTLVELRKPGEAAFYAERAKARTLVDMMETALVWKPEIMPAQLQTASRPLRQLSVAQSMEVPGVRSQGKRSGLVRAAERAQKELQDYIAKLAEDNPVLSNTLTVDPQRISSYCEAVEGELGEGEVVLEYFVAEEETVLWVISRDGIQTASVIPISRAELVDRVREFRKELNTAPSPGEEATRVLRARALGKELYDLLIAPVEKYIQTASHLVIVPSDVLFYLPFGALFRCSGCEEKRELWGGRYLIECYSISYAPSLASLYWPFRHRGEGMYESALVVGNPTGDLKFAAQEAESIASLFERSDLLIGDEATKERVLKLLGEKRYDVVHLSTHGQFDRELPLASKVLLVGGEGLYAGEMMGLRLGEEVDGKWEGCELVVLSACQTGLPPEVKEELVLGDELQGLSQALFVAGTPSAVLTLWNVNDQSTSQLMEEMYKELMGGVPKGEALRRAQLFLLRSTMYRHPYFWAPFVLYGVWR